MRQNSSETGRTVQGDALAKCLHPSVRDGFWCTLCGALVEDWKLRRCAKKLAELRAQWLAGELSEALWLVHREVELREIEEIGWRMIL